MSWYNYLVLSVLKDLAVRASVPTAISRSLKVSPVFYNFMETRECIEIFKNDYEIIKITCNFNRVIYTFAFKPDGNKSTFTNFLDAMFQKGNVTLLSCFD